MITRSQISLPDFFDRYINLVDDVTVIAALKKGLEELRNMPVEQWRKLGSRVYAPGKWTIADVIQHVTDTERVFAYRALSFARGERNVRSFDEDAYAAAAGGFTRPLNDLKEEVINLRISTIDLFSSFNEDILEKTGISFKGDYSVRAVGYIIAGHQRWHARVIRERYMPLLTDADQIKP